MIGLTILVVIALYWLLARTVTKDLVKLNPWLFDAGRIHFNYPDKVLIAEGTTIDSTQDHTLQGDAHAANVLKDGKYFRFEREVA